MRAYVRVCICACVRVCVCACVCYCVCTCNNKQAPLGHTHSFLSPQVDRNHYGDCNPKVPAVSALLDNANTSTPADPEETALTEMARLTKYIYNVSGVDGGDMGRIRTRAMLCHIYHHALHNRWVQAHDLMLMSHLQEGIHLADIPTQVRVTTCPPLPYNLIDSLIRCKLWREGKKSAEK